MTYLQGGSKPMATWPESLGVPKDNTRNARIWNSIWCYRSLCHFPKGITWHKSQSSKDCDKVHGVGNTVLGWNEGIPYTALTWGSWKVFWVRLLCYACLFLILWSWLTLTALCTGSWWEWSPSLLRVKELSPAKLNLTDEVPGKQVRSRGWQSVADGC